MRLVIWGTGAFEDELYKEGIVGDIVGYLDGRSFGTVENRSHRGLSVFSFETIPDDYDFIIVAFNDTDEAYKIIEEKGISRNRVVFLRAGKKYRWFNDDPRIKECFCAQRWNKYLAEYSVTKNSFVDEDREKYSSLNQDDTFCIQDQYLWPIVGDKYAQNGCMAEYFWQDLWGARRVINLLKDSYAKEQMHWDIGSRVDGFLAHLLAAGISVSVIDVRPFPAEIEGLRGFCDDATSLTQIQDASIYSFSAFCSIEHFGLGRYGDPINPGAWQKCIENIQKKMIAGGHIFISLPIGKQRVEFNAHRVFYARTIIEQFHDCKLLEFDVVRPDCSGIDEDVRIEKYDSLERSHVVGLFHFIKQ